nr:immunoglobulin light chain junction region [Macaca mulatta]
DYYCTLYMGRGIHVF